MVPAGKRAAVVEALQAENIDYVLTDETSGREYTAVVSFPLPTGAVEPILERLREAGIERDAYTVVVTAETVVSDRFDELVEEYEAESGDDDRIAREELASRAEQMAPETRTFTVLAVVSAVVATAGLLLDSPAVVVGSMVIAPLLGPAMATAVGTVVDEQALFRRGVGLQVGGGLLAVAAATVFAAVLRFSGVVPVDAATVFATPEVAERLTPGLLALPIALGAGVAGALSLSAGVSAALVGVMIAAALVPPTAVVGIGVAWGRPMAVIGAGLLVVVNYLSINATALGTLWYRGYRPDDRFGFETATGTRRRLAVVTVVLAVATALLGGATLAGSQTATVEQAAGEETRALLADQPGSFVGVETETAGVLFRQPTRMTVTVAVPPDAPYPAVADPLAARLGPITREAFADLPWTVSPPAVRVEFVRVERASADGQTDTAASTDATGVSGARLTTTATATHRRSRTRGGTADRPDLSTTP
jgi:uncharacterized hydrophobic protein (TIGR00341 family)